MAIHNERGIEGEVRAAGFLRQMGFGIMERNWRFGRFEIDIIASREDVLHFIEVKTRHSDAYGFPEESVTRKKFANIKRAAEEFHFRNPEWREIQYDILSVSRRAGMKDEFVLFEDVFI